MPSAYHRHPEFGYFWLSPRLRRTAKLVLAFIVLASMAAASQMIVQLADRGEPNAGEWPLIAAVPLDPSAAPAVAVSPAAPAPSAGAPSVASRSAPSVSPRSAPIEASASLTIKPPQTQLIATPKKPRKAARSHNRRRERDWYDAYASPRREDSWSLRERDYGSSHFWRPGW